MAIGPPRRREAGTNACFTLAGANDLEKGSRVDCGLVKNDPSECSIKMSMVAFRRLARTLMPACGLMAISSWILLRPAAADEIEPTVEIDVRSRLTATARLVADNARVSQWSNLIDFSVPVAGSKAFGLGLDFVTEQLEFDFRDFGELLLGRSSPLARASVITVQPTLLLTPTPLWSLVGSGSLQYSGAESARSRDSVLMNGSLAAAYQYTAALKIGLGLAITQRMSGPALYLPFPIIDWRISARWSLTAVDGESGQLMYTFAKGLGVFGQLEYQSRDIRLGRSSSIPSGVLRYEAFLLGLGIQCKTGQHLTASVYSGVAVAQRYRFADENGRWLLTSKNHSPPVASVELDYRF